MSGKCVVGSEEKQWLEHNRYYGDLDESKLISIFYFTLIWNLFEKECCDNDATINKHPKEIAANYSNDLSSEMIDKVYSYFLGRYVSDGQMRHLFNEFRFGKNPQDGKPFKDFVSETLLSANVSKQNQLQALLYIAFRLRNNLYHGIKDVSKLYEQNENFRQINRLLMALIDAK